MDFSGYRWPGADRWPYQQIADAIAEAIASGEIGPGEAIPTEQAMMDATGAARGTVRRAITELRRQGTVYTVKYLGSFASPRKDGQRG